MKRINPAQFANCENYEGECKTIGQVADDFKISNRTLRFYEQMGLLQPVKQNARRFFFKTHTDRISKIIQYQESGLSLQQIRELFRSEGNSGIEQSNKFSPSELENMIARLRVRRDEINVAIDQFELLLAETIARTDNCSASRR